MTPVGDVSDYLLRFGRASCQELRYATLFRWTPNQIVMALRSLASRGAVWHIPRKRHLGGDWILVDPQKLKTEAEKSKPKKRIAGPPLISCITF